LMASLIQAVLHGLTMQLAADPAAFDGPAMLELCLDVLGSYLGLPPADAAPRKGAARSKTASATPARPRNGAPLAAPRRAVSDPSANPNHEPPTGAARNGPALSLRDRVKSLRLPERPPAKRSPLGLIPWVLCLIFMASTIVMAMRQKPADASDSDANKTVDQ